MSAQSDVVIVGAGVAGLAAAKELARRGISFVVVEASHRIGGRAYSEEIAPQTWFDLGCAYLNEGPDARTREDESNPFIQYAIDNEIVIEKYRHPHRLVYNSRLLTDKETSAYRRYHQDCDAAIRRCAESDTDRAISDLIDTMSPYATPYSDMMSVTVPKDLDEASAADFYFGIDEAVDYNTQIGFGNVIAHWGQGTDVTLNCRVQCIDWSGKQIRVDTLKGVLKARCLISTVSNGIQAANKIRFTPNLPDWKMDAFREVTMGAENKIGVYFTAPVFAPGDSGYYQVWSDHAEGAYVDVNLVSTNVVSVFVGGRFSRWMEKQGRAAAHEFALARIADIFGNDLRKVAGQSIASAWCTDPWTLGSYASANPGHFHRRKSLPLPIDDRLFFAGEATARCNGTCHGAYWSGIRAAREVAAALR